MYFCFFKGTKPVEDDYEDHDSQENQRYTGNGRENHRYTGNDSHQEVEAAPPPPIGNWADELSDASPEHVIILESVNFLALVL